MSIKELMQFKGIGEANAFDEMVGVMTDLPHEEFWVMYLDRRNAVIKKMNVSKGGVTGTVADSKIIFKEAIQLLASAVILLHNHPSGNLKPSDADIQLTKKMVEIGKIMETPVLDHLIITDKGYFSFSDQGLM